jgi:hypothetical protein
MEVAGIMMVGESSTSSGFTLTVSSTSSGFTMTVSAPIVSF